MMLLLLLPLPLLLLLQQTAGLGVNKLDSKWRGMVVRWELNDKRERESENKMCVNLKGYISTPNAFGDSLKQCKFYTHSQHNERILYAIFFLSVSKHVVRFDPLFVRTCVCVLFYIRTHNFLCLHHTYTLLYHVFVGSNAPNATFETNTVGRSRNDTHIFPMPKMSWCSRRRTPA